MRFEWHELDPVGFGNSVWGLYLVKAGTFRDCLGVLTQLNRAWRIMERRPNKPDYYWLDGSLTLEEAQRAAKLFLCVGRDYMEKRA